jgi:hypothetical protein
MVQPFNLSFAPDDLHVMAFISGHPEYEAVEAMIRLRAGRAPLVRAIITRHDQSQVDHSNADPGTPDPAGERESCRREIACRLEDRGTSRRAVVRFESFRGEIVELDVTSHGPPDAQRGGLSDPGRHSVASSLPVMHRGRSALAAPSSRVAIAGRTHEIVPRIQAEGRVIALEGFLTEQHHMAAIRSAQAELELVEMPTAFKEGERWVYRSGSGLASYGISRISASGDIEITRSDSKLEWIHGRLAGNGIALHTLHVRDPVEPRLFASLVLAGGTFAIGMDGVEGWVTGAVESSVVDDAQVSIALFPGVPSWAAERVVRVVASRGPSGSISVRTTVGSPA